MNSQQQLSPLGCMPCSALISRPVPYPACDVIFLQVASYELLASLRPHAVTPPSLEVGGVRVTVEMSG